MRTTYAIDKKLRDWLRTHHGVIGQSEARQLGATEGLVRAKLAMGEWEEVHRSVYRDAASAKTDHQRLRAACVLTAPVGVASHRSAAWLWGMRDRPPGTPELTVPHGCHHGERTKGVVVHRSRDLDRSSVRQWEGLPVTTPLRTLVDLGALVTPQQLADAVDRALAKQLITIPRLLDEVNRLGRRGRRGAGALRQLLKDRGFIGVPHPSVLESKALRIFGRYRLPIPECELVVGPDGEYRLDFAYPAIKLAIEVDGYVWHFSPAHKERDETRRNAITLSGWTILVYSWPRITQDPVGVAAEIAEAFRTAA
jgi:hypothetical protein